MAYIDRKDAHPSHNFSEDWSYHGSPSWHCEYCGLWNHDSLSVSPCTKREAVLEQRRVEREQQECAEYQQMLSERRRFEELHAKYGGT